MTALVIILTLVLITIVTVQIGRLTELAATIRGEEEAKAISTKRTAIGLVVFMVLFLAACIFSSVYYADSFLGYGPHKSASEHGKLLDSTFNITLFFTGIVFIVTQVLLFWYGYKYREQKGRTALYIAHDNRIEIIWTVVPAVVMTFLVVYGLDTWNTVMKDVGENEIPGTDYIEIEATGHQFAWTIRYPGEDNLLGERDFRLINGANNPLGQNWEDAKNHDDLHTNEIVLPVGKKVRVRITSKDVLHNFYLPHFRVKMDAVPGMPTYFIFTPKTTTTEYRERLSAYPEWQQPADPSAPEGARRWETFEYELACAELCGNGHFSMKKIVRIVSESEYNAWLSEQKSYYLENVKAKETTVEQTTENTTVSDSTTTTVTEETTTETNH